MATLLMRPGDGASADKKRRARKGKNALKKQPQRGLGVAQLEKLRLQEQNLLYPASPAYSLRLCSTPPEHPTARCDTDVAQTIISLTTSNLHAQLGRGGSCSTVVRGGEVGTVSRLSMSDHSTTQSCLSPPVIQDKGHDEAVHAAAMNRAVASRALACLSGASKFSSVNAKFFPNVLTANQMQILETQAQLKAEERRAAAAGDQAGNPPAYTFPTVNNYVKEAGGSYMSDADFKLLSVFKEHVQARIPLNLTDPHYLETLIGSDASHLPRKRLELPMVSGRKRPWIALQESAKHACPAQALDLNSPAGENDHAGHSECPSRRLNQTPENRIGAHYTTGIVRSALGNSSLPLGAKTKVCSSVSRNWSDSDSLPSVSAYFSDVGMNQDNGTGYRRCPSQSSVKDSCSSATGSSTQLSLCSRQRGRNVPEVPSSLIEKESICSNFLTLGISTSSYTDRSGWNEPEESIQDDDSPMSINNVSGLNPQDYTTMGSEGDNHASQVNRKFISKQELGVDLVGGPTKCLSLEYGGGDRRSMLLREPHITTTSPKYYSSKGFSSFPPPFIASTNHGHAQQFSLDHCDPSAKSARIVEDILDLSLKLAL